MLVLFLVGFIPHLNLKTSLFIYFDNSIVKMGILGWGGGSWRDLNPKHLYWKHQEGPIELQDFLKIIWYDAVMIAEATRGHASLWLCIPPEAMLHYVCIYGSEAFVLICQKWVFKHPI